MIRIVWVVAVLLWQRANLYALDVSYRSPVETARRPCLVAEEAVILDLDVEPMTAGVASLAVQYF